MYTITFSSETLRDLLNNRVKGRQFYAAVLMPYSGIFTSAKYGDGNTPKIVCPYQVNDIISIQEKWARNRSNYVYQIDGKTGYNFRPATTMPIDATRIWGRIVSVVPWIVTQEIIDKYLSYGFSADSYAGAAKVVDYYDTGTKLLSSTRNLHNRSLLGKLRQPVILSDPPKISKSIYYHLHQSHDYLLYPRKLDDTSPVPPVLNGPTSPYAIAAALPDVRERDEHGTLLSHTVYDYVLLGSGEQYPMPNVDFPLGAPIDNTGGKWAFVSTFNEKTTPESLEGFRYVGLDKRSTYGPADEHGVRPPVKLRYVYLYNQKNSEGETVYIPNFATYQADIIDPSYNLYAWLISGYLCSRDGEITGTYY